MNKTLDENVTNLDRYHAAGLACYGTRANEGHCSRGVSVAARRLRLSMKRLLAISIALFCFAILASSASGITRIENTVVIADPHVQTLHVVSIIKGIRQSDLDVAIPAWTPGHYVTEDYARNISRLVFFDQSGHALSHRKTQDSVWRINTCGVEQVRIASSDSLAVAVMCGRTKQ